MDDLPPELPPELPPTSDPDCLHTSRTQTGVQETWNVDHYDRLRVMSCDACGDCVLIP